MNSNHQDIELDRLLARPVLPADRGFTASVRLRIEHEAGRKRRILFVMLAFWVLVTAVFGAPSRLYEFFSKLTDQWLGMVESILSGTGSDLTVMPAYALLLFGCGVVVALCLVLRD